MQHIITILPKADGIPTSTKQEIAYVEIAILADSNTKYSAMLLAGFAALLKVKFLFTTKLKTVEINNDVTLDNWILQLIASLKKKKSAKVNRSRDNADEQISTPPAPAWTKHLFCCA